MRVYYYKIHWKDENNKYQRYYAEAESEKAAIEDFETTTGKTMSDLKADIRRIV